MNLAVLLILVLILGTDKIKSHHPLPIKFCREKAVHSAPIYQLYSLGNQPPSA